MMPRVGILGVAHLHADAYIGNLRAAGADVVGVFDHDGPRAQAWDRGFGVPTVARLDDLLSAELDAVVVCSETARHAALAERAAAAGCAVLCEKPLGVGHDDTARILAACDAAGVPLMTAF